MILQYNLDTSHYKQETILLLGISGQEAGKEINSHGNLDKIEEKNDCRGFVFDTSYMNKESYQKGRFYIYVNVNDLTEEQTTLEHELIHLTWVILDWVGVKVSANNHEAFTYFYEHLLKQIRIIIKTNTKQIAKTLLNNKN
jgi:hypothetical protein